MSLLGRNNQFPDPLPLTAHPTTSKALPEPQTTDMEQDFHGDLENRAFKIHGRLPGVSTSMHAPHNREVSEATPDLPNLTLTTPGPQRLEALDIHPSILALFNHMQTTLATSFNTIFTRLNNQDKSIDKLSKPKDPRRKNVSKTMAPAALPTHPTTPIPAVPIPTPPTPTPALPHAPTTAGDSTNVLAQEVYPGPIICLGPPPGPQQT